MRAIDRQGRPNIRDYFNQALKLALSPGGLQVLGLLIVVSGLIDARERETSQAWIEVGGGAALIVIGWKRGRRAG